MDCWLNLCVCSGLGMVDSGDQLPADSPFAQCLSSQAQAVGTPSLEHSLQQFRREKTLLQNANSQILYPFVILLPICLMKTPRCPTSSAAPASAGEWPL